MATSGMKRYRFFRPQPPSPDSHTLSLPPYAIGLAHLVELVDAHGSPVRQHHRPRFQAPVARVAVCDHSGRQSHARGATPGGGDGEHGGVEDSAEELREGRREGGREGGRKEGRKGR